MTDIITQATRIKTRLNACKTKDEVEHVADEERDTVRAMSKMEGDGKTMAIQITNLKAHMLKEVGE